MNKGLYSGTLGSVEFKSYGSEGKELAVFHLTTTEGKQTTTLSITAFGADDIALLRRADEGDRLYVEGRTNNRTWQSPNGPRSALEILASRIEAIGEPDLAF